MTQSEFFKIKTSGGPISLARQIELQKSGVLPVNDFLLEFCKKMHTQKAYIEPSRTGVLVYTKTKYRYELCPTTIIRTQNSYSGSEVRVYDLPENLWQK